MQITPNTSNALAQLGTFLRSVLPDGVEVILGQQNRVPEPDGTEFVVMTPIRYVRLRTNIDTPVDSRFTGSIADDVLDVSAVDPNLDGAIQVGSYVAGENVAIGTRVLGLLTGTGGVGTYRVTPPQTLASQTLAAGRVDVEQGSQETVQLDFHSADLRTSGDWAQTVATLMRDEFAVDSFAAQTPNYGVVPLYADDPRQAPFRNAEDQYEWRWVLEAMLQVNAVVSVPQQFADSIELELIDVDVTYGP